MEWHIHALWMCGSKDILGISKYFQTWRQIAMLKQANKQIKKPTKNRTSKTTQKKKRERGSMFVKTEVSSASSILIK